MKNAIKVFCFVLVAVIAIVGGVYFYFTWDVGEFVTAEGTQSGTVIITEYIGEETDVDIPNRLRGKKVVTVGDFAFNESNITSVKFGDYVNTIEVNAFQNCEKLTTVDLGKNVKNIDDGAFSNCPELVKVTFSPKVEKLGKLVFGNDKKLEKIGLNGNENFKIESGILYSADMTTIHLTLDSADLSNYQLPATVTSIHPCAFYAHDELKSIKLNDGIKKIDEGIFVDCKGLSELVIPDSVTSIGTLVFTGSGVKTVTIPPSVTKIDEGAFYNVEKQITIITTKRSAAARLAEKQGIKLEIVDSL